MLSDGKYTYSGKEIEAVKVREPKCDGCMFEHSAIGRDCQGINKPECVGHLREDGADVIFRYKAAGRRQKKRK